MAQEAQQLKITFRRMTKQDISTVCEFDSGTKDFGSSAAILTALASNDAHSFVAVQNGAVIAYCAYTQTLNIANLDAICVSKNHRRCGVAKMLMAYTIEELLKNGALTFWLEVRSENRGAIKLYESMNFTQNGMRKNYYKNPNDDAVLMELNI